MRGRQAVLFSRSWTLPSNRADDGATAWKTGKVGYDHRLIFDLRKARYDPEDKEAMIDTAGGD